MEINVAGDVCQIFPTEILERFQNNKKYFRQLYDFKDWDNAMFLKEECGCEFPSIKAGTTGELGTLRNLLKLKLKKAIQKLAEIWKQQCKSGSIIHSRGRDRMTI